jgi:hypothetical protein
MKPQLVDDDIAQHSGIVNRLYRLEQNAIGSDWSDLPMVSPWSQYDATSWRARYRKIAGVVIVEGLVINSVAFSYAGAGTNLQIAQMPVGFRPGMNLMGEGYMVSTASIRIILRIDLQTSGSMAIVANNDWSYYPTVSNNGAAFWVKLSFLPYVAEN